MRWRILQKISSSEQEKIGIDLLNQKILKIILENRGLKNKNQQEKFLNPLPLEKISYSDLGISLKELKKTIKRIQQAIKRKEKIIIYGDYDTDGICATAILWEALYRQKAEVMPFIPRRQEGYGLKSERLKEMSNQGVKLVITVDQGITALRQAETAKKLGIDLIITDHHLSGEKKPSAFSIIHTVEISGAGIAWFLARELGDDSGLDLATIAVITDVIPLIGPARSLVKWGLPKLRNTKRVGLLALFEKAGINPEKIDTYHIGFIIGPRLNASGRIDDPLDSLRLICTKDKQKANFLAEKIEERNKKRQLLTEEITQHARKLWLETDGKSALIFVSHETYEEGVIGLVASNLMQEFYRPAIVLAPRGKDWVASARSIEEFNIVEAVRTCAQFLGNHGGHKKAAGFSIEEEKISLVKERLIALAESQLDKEKLKPTLIIDLELPLSFLSLSLYRKIKKMAPFGEGNPFPFFASRGLEIVNAQLIGEDRHLKLWLKEKENPTIFEAIGFGMGKIFSSLSPEGEIDIAYTLSLDEWNGKEKLQLNLKDVKLR
ncbi:MAG: single-stranded-DNA-specific exonuclease RecJ [Microgenomates group bacterium]